MASRNRLINGPVGEIEVKAAKFRQVLYNRTTGVNIMTRSQEECDDALASGDWVDTPAKVGLVDIEDKDDEKSIADIDRWVEPIEPPERTSIKKDTPRYVSQMNVDQLIDKGKEYGLDFSKDTPTKRAMKTKIWKAQDE